MKTKLYISTIAVLILMTSCGNKSFTYTIPSFNDQYLFDYVKIEKSDNPRLFNRKAFYDDEEYSDMDCFLENNKTLSFIVIRNDSILYERYFYDTLTHPKTPVFSISKSIVSALLGIAIEEGFIKSIKEPITNYIPELHDFKDITLEMLLNMCSGLDYGGIMKEANIYFSTNLRELIKDYYIDKRPGREYSYENINTLLLCIAIENATGTDIATFLENEIWQKAGMEYDASWSVDSKENNQAKGFCGINAAPIDLARFGSIYLHNGFYNGYQIIPQEWIKESLTKYNKHKDENGHYYSYSWRIINDDAFVAVGLMGQYIYVNTEKNIVVVRTGQSYDKFNWIDYIEEMTELL